MSTWARPARRRSVSATACAVVPPRPASISSNTIVSPPATAAIASATRESSPPEAVSATGPNGNPGVRPDQERDVVGAGRTGIALTQHDTELTVAEADRLQLGCHGRREGIRRPAAGRPQLRVQAVDLRLRRGQRRGRRLDGVVPIGNQLELVPRGLPALQQLGERLGAVAPLQVGEGLELFFELLEPAGLRLERGEKCVQIRCGLTQLQAGLAQRLSGGLQLRREPLDGCDGTLGERDEVRRALALVRRQGRRRVRNAFCELREVQQPLPFCSQLVLTAWCETGCVVGNQPQLVEPRLRPGRIAGQLVVAAPGSSQLTPGARGCPRVQPCECVEHAPLVGGPREAPLFELAAHRDQRLGCRGDVFASGATPPRVGPRAPVGEDPARQDETVLSVRPQLRESAQRLVVHVVELGLHVRLLARGADQRRVAARAEQEADRIGEDRLAGAGLAGDRVQAGSEP